MTAAALLQTVTSSSPGLIDIGLRMALVGMVTVFSGLVILSFSLPLIRRIAEGSKKTSTPALTVKESKELSREEVVAITAAVHAHLNKLNRMEDMKLTWEMYEKPYAPWRLAGRARLLTDRARFIQRKRSR